MPSTTLSARSPARPAQRPPRRGRGRGRRPVSQPGRIRTLGPLCALAVPVLLLVVAAAVWQIWSCDGLGCVRPSTVSYLLWMMAAPTTVATGIPLYFSTGAVAAALGSSLVIWLVLGRWAAGRATADVDATWRDFWAELAVMAVAVWAGLGVGALAIVVWLGR